MYSLKTSRGVGEGCCGRGVTEKGGEVLPTEGVVKAFRVLRERGDRKRWRGGKRGLARYSTFVRFRVYLSLSGLDQFLRIA
jgi:hypothetical protein